MQIDKVSEIPVSPVIKWPWTDDWWILSMQIFWNTSIIRQILVDQKCNGFWWAYMLPSFWFTLQFFESRMTCVPVTWIPVMKWSSTDGWRTLTSEMLLIRNVALLVNLYIDVILVYLIVFRKQNGMWCYDTIEVGKFHRLSIAITESDLTADDRLGWLWPWRLISVKAPFEGPTILSMTHVGNRWITDIRDTFRKAQRPLPSLAQRANSFWPGNDRMTRNVWHLLVLCRHYDAIFLWSTIKGDSTSHNIILSAIGTVTSFICSPIWSHHYSRVTPLWSLRVNWLHYLTQSDKGCHPD